MSGIKKKAEKMPAIFGPNKRPEVPCKNNDIMMTELEDALAFITERGNLN